MVGFDRLVRALETITIDNLDVENAASTALDLLIDTREVESTEISSGILAFAEVHGLSRLQGSCEEFIARYYEKASSKVDWAEVSGK
jgi:hypothetical protein